MEEWRDINGYEGLYQVSNLSRVKSLGKYINSSNQKGVPYKRYKKESIMKIDVRTDGYRSVRLFKDSIKKCHKVHRLVAEAFIPNPENKPQVNHRNGIKHDNALSNLEWSTSSENIKHAFDIGLKTLKGSSQTTAKLSDDNVIEILRLLKDGTTHSEISKRFNITDSSISKIKTGKSWSHLTGIEFKSQLLSEENVIEIHNMIKEGVFCRIIAKKYNVSSACVSCIKRGQTWSDITGVEYKRRKKSI